MRRGEDGSGGLCFFGAGKNKKRNRVHRKQVAKIKHRGEAGL